MQAVSGLMCRTTNPTNAPFHQHLTSDNQLSNAVDPKTQLQNTPTRTHPKAIPTSNPHLQTLTLPATPYPSHSLEPYPKTHP